MATASRAPRPPPRAPLPRPSSPHPPPAPGFLGAPPPDRDQHPGSARTRGGPGRSERAAGGEAAPLPARPSGAVDWEVLFPRVPFAPPRSHRGLPEGGDGLVTFRVRNEGWGRRAHGTRAPGLAPLRPPAGGSCGARRGGAVVPSGVCTKPSPPRLISVNPHDSPPRAGRQRIPFRGEGAPTGLASSRSRQAGGGSVGFRSPRLFPGAALGDPGERSPGRWPQGLGAPPRGRGNGPPRVRGPGAHGRTVAARFPPSPAASPPGR